MSQWKMFCLITDFILFTALLKRPLEDVLGVLQQKGNTDWSSRGNDVAANTCI